MSWYAIKEVGFGGLSGGHGMTEGQRVTLLRRFQSAVTYAQQGVDALNNNDPQTANVALQRIKQRIAGLDGVFKYILG
jgi:hypothetical protein